MHFTLVLAPEAPASRGFELGSAGVAALDNDAEIATLPTLDAIAGTIGGLMLTKFVGKAKAVGPSSASLSITYA